MRAVKQFSFKLIVILCVVSTLFCFVASTPVYSASKVKTDEFYYSGTTKGSYTVDKGFLERLVETLGAILDYILGIMSMLAGRMVFVGWTEIMEQMLTWVIEGGSGVEVNVENVEPTYLPDPDDYITVEAIVFNHILLFNINVFDYEENENYDSLGHELKVTGIDENGNEIREQSDISKDSLINILKRVIAGWYYSFRLISIMLMLVLLIYIGVKLALASAAKEKALYKQVLLDWVVGMVLVFSIHYIILAMIGFNELLVDEISKMKLGHQSLEYYEYGLKERADTGVTDEEMEVSIYDEVRTRAYDARLSVGIPGAVMYSILVYYAWKFSFIYIKRYLIVAVLIMVAPFVAVAYAYNKVKTGKTFIFTNWLKELFFMIILQSIHALLYVIFFESALAISLSSIGGMLLAFVMLNFMSKAETIFRKIFNVQGNLTSDVAGSKLSDIGKIVSSASLAKTNAKAAVATTKLAARVVTKPARLIGNYGFGKIMEHRANRMGAQSQGNFIEGLREDEEDNITRQNQLRLGAEAVNLPSNIKDLTKEQRKKLEELRKSIPMASKKNEGATMDSEEFIQNFYEKKDEYAANYNILTKKPSVFGHEVSTRWNEIMNPFQYVRKEADVLDENGNVIKEGKYKRIKNKREHDNWLPGIKHLSKKKDGTGVILSKYMNVEYLLGITKKESVALKNQVGLIGAELAGFAGLLIGVPLLVTEPAIGMALLAKGISSNSKAFGRDSVAKRKNLSGMYMTMDGKWHLAGYDGSSIQTIRNGVQAAAREDFQRLETERIINDQKAINRTKKHKALMAKLTGNVNVNNAGKSTVRTVALNNIKDMKSNPMIDGQIVRVAPNTGFKGRILNSFGSNAQMAFLETLTVARKQAAKDFEGDLKSTDDLLNYLADKYYKVEEDKKKTDIGTDTIALAAVYGKALDDRIKSVDNMTDAELINETGYDEDFKFTEDKEGKKTLSADTEKDVIDKAIIEIVEKSGIINLDEFNIEDETKLSQVKKVITDRLVNKGVLSKTQKAEDIIENLENKILYQKAKLEKTRPNAVEEKMVDDSIIEIMSEKGIDNIQNIETGDVMQKFSEKYQNMVDTPSDQTFAALQGLANQKAKSVSKDIRSSEQIIQELQSNTGRNKTEELMDRVQNTTIAARKTIIGEKPKAELDDKTRNKLKETIVKKRIDELDQKMVSNEINVKENPSEVEEVIKKKQDTDEVLKMLELQTKLHQDKMQLELATNRKNSKEKERLQNYKAQSLLFNDDGSINVSATNDGALRVNSVKDGSRKVEDTYGTKANEISVIDIINKVKSEKNV